ncbi:MAG: YCF48-related protein [Ginsengibacter sp.]
MVTALVINHLSASAQWQWLNPKPTGYNNIKITFTGTSTGYLLNTNGDLFQTTDAGTNWTLKSNFANPLCMDIRDSTGVIGCYSGILYLSDDNGASWKMINTGISTPYQTVNIVSRDTFFLSSGTDVSNGYGNIYETTDRGNTWTHLHCDVSIKSISFTDSKTAYVGSLGGKILKTEDGGISWQQKRSESYIPSGIKAIQFPDKENGFAYEEYDKLLITHDGGNTWNATTSNMASDIYCMYFINPSDGYLAGLDGGVYATHDGGKTVEWIGFDGLRDGNSIYSLYFASKDTGFAVGQLGRIMKTTDAGKTWQGYSPLYLPVTALSFADSTTGYATSWNNVYKTTDKGNSWTPLGITAAGQSRFEQAHFVSRDTGFITSSYPPVIHHTFDGGITWDSIPVSRSIYSDMISESQFLNPKTGYLAMKSTSGGSRGYIAKTTDGGITWNPVYVPPYNGIPFYHIYFINEDTGYAASYAQLYKTTDGAITWNPVYSNTYNYEITAISFIDSIRGFFTDDNNDIISTHDAGKTWTTVRVSDFTPVTNGEIKTIQFFDPRVGFLATVNGAGPVNAGDIYETTDSGYSWKKIKNVGANSLLFTTDTSVIAFGYGGDILRKKIKEADVDSIQLSGTCRDSLSALVTALFSRVDSISFEITDSAGDTVYKAASPFAVDNARLACKAPLSGLSPTTIYKVRVKYFYEDSSHISREAYISTGSVPNITRSGNVLTSSYQTGNQWFRNDTLITGATQASYALPDITYDQCYKVQSSISRGCKAFSDTICFDPAVTLPSLQIQSSYNNGQVLLFWSTGTETNTGHFEIERSSDGISYETIGSMAAAGNSATEQHYAYNDNIAGQNQELKYYYRVKLIYLDSEYVYSNVISLIIPEKKARITIAPNPARNNIVIYFPEPLLSATVLVFDRYGRQVLSDKFSNGVHDNCPLNVSSFETGIYTIKIISNIGIFQANMVIVK